MRRTYFRRPQPKPRTPRTRINDFIRLSRARVIGPEGEQFGIMSSFEALQIAREKELDLVEISPKADPPVLKIMDFGKYQYQKSREERQNKAKQKKFDIKGIRLRVRTDDHDLNFKREQAEKFLKKGNKVKIEIILRGREKAHQDLARENLGKFLASISIPFKSEQEIKRFPGGFNTIITPQ